MDEFAASFQKEHDRIAEDIPYLEISQVPETQTAITGLSEQVRDNVFLIPAHDRKVYDGRIKDLQQKLKDRQTTIAPKKKFAFSSKGTFSSRKTEPELKMQASQSTKISNANEIVHVANGTKTNAVTYENLSNIRITLDHNREEAASSPCHLSNLSSCIVDMRDQTSKTTSFASLTAKEVDDSIIVSDQVHGPVHLTAIRDSILVVSAKQFRMHKSQNCDVYLQMTSRPIIEDCSNIRFTTLPDFLRISSDEPADSKSIEVDDFNWHRAEPSPNWTILADKDVIKSERWQAILEEKSLAVKDVLKGVKSDAAANAVA